ncbi:MAG: GNAT family N-acetyltransferase [Chloroflexi bacterium]|nr:GNAT family N-acetyltransferase [Chloroflexota bacterium]
MATKASRKAHTGDHVRVYKISDYPKEVTLLDGTSLTLRPMTPQDEDTLLEFFCRVPEGDRRYLKEDVTSPEVIAQWSRNLDYNRAVPLLAVDGGHVVANATLHRRRAIARSHMGEVRIVVEPAYRGRGLGTMMLRDLINIAVDAGLERLLFELAADEEAQAIEAAERLGFITVATLPYHVKDSTGKPHDLVIMELPLGKWYEWWQF